MVDPRAAMIILRVLIRKLGLQIEMKELEDQAKEIDDALKKGGDKESPAGQPGKGKYVG
jgi:proteasome assembly chaperone (PAC2) family protein